jgi:tRNA dimethylallyltransferase
MDAPVFIVGATGVGKSGAGMELARRWGGAVLCLDAMQVYRGAAIGTGKPTAAERAEVLHGGLDLVELGERFDVAQYLTHAAEFLREQRTAGRRVIIVGGTGLYFRALTRGLCEAPQGPEELRAELNGLTVGELRSRLEKIDPRMLEKVDAANPRRLVRAIEVMESTGRSLADWQAETPEPLVREFTAVWIQREKAELEARMAARVEAMFAAGWVEEVRGLVEKYGMAVVQGFSGIGYREIAEGMQETEAELILRQAQDDGELREGVVASLKRDILVATRQYAKRQLTWFAREPNLQPVILTGHESLSAAMLRMAVAPALF